MRGRLPASGPGIYARRGYPFLKQAQHLWRIGADEKSELIHKRTYPLSWDALGVTDKPFREKEGDE